MYDLAEFQPGFRALDEIEKGYLTTKLYVRNEPIANWVALPALVLPAVALALRMLLAFVPPH